MNVISEIETSVRHAATVSMKRSLYIVVFWTYATGETPLILCTILEDITNVVGICETTVDGLVLGIEDGNILETIDG